jgi:hypothetical protein
MKKKWSTKSLLALAILIGFLTVPALTLGKEAVQQWDLINPEGAIKIEPMKVNPHPTTLVGKTVVLRANGKHNADNFLNRIAELLQKEVKDIKIIKAWEVAPETNTISQNPDLSKKFAEKIASFKPNLVIASQCD